MDYYHALTQVRSLSKTVDHPSTLIAHIWQSYCVGNCQFHGHTDSRLASARVGFSFSWIPRPHPVTGACFWQCPEWRGAHIQRGVQYLQRLSNNCLKSEECSGLEDNLRHTENENLRLKCSTLASQYWVVMASQRLELSTWCMSLRLHLRSRCISVWRRLSSKPEHSSDFNNYLTAVEDIEHLVECEHLSILDIARTSSSHRMWSEVFRKMKKPTRADANGNPCVREIDNYRRNMIVKCVQLTYLDDRPVFDKERTCVNACNNPLKVISYIEIVQIVNRKRFTDVYFIQGCRWSRSWKIGTRTLDSGWATENPGQRKLYLQNKNTHIS